MLLIAKKKIWFLDLFLDHPAENSFSVEFSAKLQKRGPPSLKADPPFVFSNGPKKKEDPGGGNFVWAVIPKAALGKSSPRTLAVPCAHKPGPPTVPNTLQS